MLDSMLDHGLELSQVKSDRRQKVSGAMKDRTVRPKALHTQKLWAKWCIYIIYC